jgi:hypothetical protein
MEQRAERIALKSYRIHRSHRSEIRDFELARSRRSVDQSLELLYVLCVNDFVSRPVPSELEIEFIEEMIPPRPSVEVVFMVVAEK